LRNLDWEEGPGESFYCPRIGSFIFQKGALPRVERESSNLKTQIVEKEPPTERWGPHLTREVPKLEEVQKVGE